MKQFNIFIFFIAKIFNARLLDNYNLENVINELTANDKTIEKQQMIREKNKYNELFVIRYKAIGKDGYKNVYDICKKYLYTYRSYMNSMNKFCIATVQNNKNEPENINLSIFNFIQRVSKLYMQRDNINSLKTDENTTIHIYDNDGNIDNYKDEIAASKFMLINNCITDDDDFALFYDNQVNHLGEYYYKDYQFIFIDLGFGSSNEKRKWLETYPFEVFFSKKRFFGGLNELSVERSEIRLQCELWHDETKNYKIDSLRFYSDIFASSIHTDEILNRHKDQIPNIPLSYSYFHKFSKEEGWRLKDNYNFIAKYSFLEKYNALDCSKKYIICCEYYCHVVKFYIVKYIRRIKIKKLPTNHDLCEVSMDIFCVQDETIKGSIRFSYFADISNVDTPFMPVYKIKKFNDEFQKSQKNFSAFLTKINEYFSQEFSTFDTEKFEFNDQIAELNLISIIFNEIEVIDDDEERDEGKDKGKKDKKDEEDEKRDEGKDCNADLGHGRKSGSFMAKLRNLTRTKDIKK